MMTDLSVNLKKTINAPIEKVFHAWLDAGTLSRFMTPLPGMPEPRVEVDGREGGSFAIYMQVGDEEIPHSGEYLEIIPHSRLVFTWKSPFSTDGSTVTIRFSALGANRTLVELVHVKFRGEAEQASHKSGWTNVLEKLGDVTEAPQVQQASA